MRNLKRWVVVAAAAAAVVVVTGSMVFANHDFADVPTSAYYHNDVSTIHALGITSGCGNGNYCPNAAVTRGQMATFLARTAGLYRAAHNEASTVLVDTLPTPVLQLKLTVSGPCDLILHGTLDWDDDGNANVLSVNWVVDGMNTGLQWAGQVEAGNANETLGFMGFRAVGAGEHQIAVRASVNILSAEIERIAGYAMCVPFDHTGGLVQP
jgi:hypothetical protein